MYEDYEGCSDTQGLEGFADSKSLNERNYISGTEQSYIEEVMPYMDSELLAARIDEMGGFQPPKAIDSNKDVSDLIEPMKEDINPIYLEAPADSVQISEAVEAMENIDGLEFKDWKESSFEERVEALQKLEDKVSEIAHRPSCYLNVQDLGEGNYGYFDPNTKEITLNSSYINSDNFADYKETLDTVLHEGRHAYQDYNITEREVHPRGTEVENWRLNNNGDLGYLDAQTWGFELYQYQPMEADARAFAGDAINQFLKG